MDASASLQQQPPQQQQAPPGSYNGISAAPNVAPTAESLPGVLYPAPFPEMNAASSAPLQWWAGADAQPPPAPAPSVFPPTPFPPSTFLADSHGSGYVTAEGDRPSFPAALLPTTDTFPRDEPLVDAPLGWPEEDNEEESGSGAEEDVGERHRPLSASAQSSQPQSRQLWTHRLHLHPLASSSRGSSFSPSGQPLALDPITEALARQQKQLYRGEPRSPLSPHTLRALLNASAEGRHASFLAQLTPEEVLAPAPLALTWYPAVPPGVTQHADRKRSADEAALVMQQRELDRLAEESSDARVQMQASSRSALGLVTPSKAEEDDEVALPPMRRSRVEPAVDPAASEPAPSATVQPAGEEEDDNGESRSDAASGSSERVSGGSERHRKREREERVYEFISHGRRLN